MRRLSGLENLPTDLPRPVVTVGTFDGVHVGHQRVLSTLVSSAREPDGAAVVVTFAQPPRQVLTGETFPLITSLPHRLLLLERAGVEVCVVLAFTRALAKTSALAFTRRVLAEGLGARGVVVGPGAGFGRNQEGDEAFLRAHAGEFGFEVRGVGRLLVDGEPVSSTRIRDAVADGDFDLTAKLLGRPFSVFGTVVPGEGRGREIGFPTANLDLHHEMMPPDGVYVAEAVLDERELPALVSVGCRPTFAGGAEAPGASVVEIYLMDFEGSLYGRDMEARFLTKLRAQERFDDVNALVLRLRDDVLRARAYLSSRPGSARKNRAENP